MFKKANFCCIAAPQPNFSLSADRPSRHFGGDTNTNWRVLSLWLQGMASVNP